MFVLEVKTTTHFSRSERLILPLFAKRLFLGAKNSRVFSKKRRSELTKTLRRVRENAEVV